MPRDAMPRSGFAHVGLYLFSASLLFASSCTRSCSVSRVNIGKTVDVPPFTVAVKLSEEAKKRLRSIDESVLVIAFFDGDALPGQGKDNSPFRDVFLGQDEKLVDANNVAKFDHTKIPVSDWNRLSDKNYFVTINAVSARKAARDNLLDCADPIDRRIEWLEGRTMEVQCRLIGEASP